MNLYTMIAESRYTKDLRTMSNDEVEEKEVSALSVFNEHTTKSVGQNLFGSLSLAAQTIEVETECLRCEEIFTASGPARRIKEFRLCSACIKINGREHIGWGGDVEETKINLFDGPTR